jgi:hypothetical protein
MKTLIHRAYSVLDRSSTVFTQPCIASAREALACHQSCPVVLAGVHSGFLTSYLGWFIFLRPFLPFIVLFYHVVETGDRDDLRRMKQFVDSMRPLSPDGPDAAMRHRQMFQTFHDVALRYVELKATSAATASSYVESSIQFGADRESGGDGGERGDKVSHDIDSCLGTIGLFPDLGMGSTSAADSLSSSAGAMTEASETPRTGMTPNLPYWFLLFNIFQSIMKSLGII